MVIILGILIASVMTFNNFKAPVNPKIDQISEFKITQLSGNGSVYFARKPIQRDQLYLARAVDIKRMDYPDEIYLMADSHTSFEFFCFDTSFTALPGSYLYYQPKTKELWFYQGQLLWRKEVKKKKVEVSIKEEHENTRESPLQIITLSDAGKAEITPNGVKVWNYSGRLKFNYGSDEYNLRSAQYLVSLKNQKVRTSPILEAPEFISPEEKVISLAQPGDSVVKFDWKVVKGAQRYILRLYSSNLMDNLLYEKETITNRLNLDLLQFEDFGQFYWQVAAYDPESNSEGVPSQMGYLKLTGALLNKEKILQPPELIITKTDVSGNLVLIEGKTDSNAHLLINDEPITLNTDGTFIHPINFETIGKHQIFFKVISASGVVRTHEESVTIYDE